MKILIVDDDENSRVFLERALLSQGYTVNSATNGVDALEKAYQWHPDLIISDILMPKMNGFELCRRIKTDEQLRNIAFIFYTATFVDQQDEELAMALGASRFLVKPVEPSDFLKIIREVISEYGTAEFSVPDRPLAEMDNLCRMEETSLARKLDKKVRELDKERKALQESEEVLRRNYDTQFAINILLQLSLDEMPLEEILKRTLDLILSIKWLAFESKGGIFIVEGDSDKLVMKAQKGLSGSLQEKCKEIPFGECFCGRAASTKEVQFSDRLDEHHDYRYDGIVPHGHYCVPILLSGKTLGVITLYLAEGHKQDQMEVEFLKIIANALAGIIHRKTLTKEREKLIHDLQKTLESVSDSQKIWQGTFDNITDLIFIYDRDFRIIRANRAFSDYFHLSPQEVLNKECHEFFYGPDSQGAVCPDSIIFEKGEPASVEIRLPGGNRILDVASFPFFSGKDEIIGAVCIARDITEEKERERRQIVTERLASLGQLSAGMAHEINNPINFIMANAQMLTDIWGDVLKILRRHYDEQGDFIIGGFSFSKNNERITRLFDGILEGSHRIKDIVANLKAFTRAKTTEHAEPVDIKGMIRATLMILESQIKSYTDRFSVDMEEDLPMVKGNSHNLEQVMSNLIINALQSLPAKKCAVTISVWFYRIGNCIVIQVRDEGIGMSAEVLEKAFLPFFTTKRESGGIGLGLSICRSIIDDHGGSLEFESKPGEGTAATVKLPVMPPEKGKM